MGKIPWSKLKFFRGRHEKEEDVDSLMSKYPNVNEEYKQAFRTKSYIDICNQVQDHIDEGQNCHLSQYLFDPSIDNSISNHTSNFHQFLANYLKTTLEACRMCETLLININLARNDHRRIKKAMKLINRLPDSSNPNEHCILYKNLASFALERNPFTTTNPQKFQELHETHVVLFEELTSKCRKINRRKKMIKLIKRAIVIGCGALVIGMLILVMHCVVGLWAAPGLLMWALVVKKMKRGEQKCDEKWLDIAARGVYIMINDFATMGRNVRRLENEMERWRYLADVCVRKRKNQMLKKVVREFQMHQSCFLEQLEELEKLIYLCFLDINRSRRLLVREMVKL